MLAVGNNPPEGCDGSSRCKTFRTYLWGTTLERISSKAKNEIELENHVDHLSVLDADGNVDKELEPDIDEALLAKLHRFMLLSRRFDERMLSLQRQSRLGTFSPIKGQEAAQLGAIAALEEHPAGPKSFSKGPA
jgi:hypothetical protein